MIKYKKNSLIRLNLKSTKAPYVPAYNIVSSKLNDDFYIYRPYKMLLTLLSKDGIFGEFETLFPTLIKSYPKYIDEYIPTIKGIPLLESIETKGEIKVFLQDNRYILIFESKENAVVKFYENNTYFYATNETIIAIECKLYEIEY